MNDPGFRMALLDEADPAHLSYMIDVVNMMPTDGLDKVAQVSWAWFLFEITERYLGMTDYMTRLADGRESSDLSSYLIGMLVKDGIPATLDKTRSIAESMRSIYSCSQAEDAEQHEYVFAGDLRCMEIVIYGSDRVMLERYPEFHETMRSLCEKMGLDYSSQHAEEMIAREYVALRDGGEYEKILSLAYDLTLFSIFAERRIREEINLMRDCAALGRWDELREQVIKVYVDHFPKKHAETLVPFYSITIRYMEKIQDMISYIKKQQTAGKKYADFLPWNCPLEYQVEGFEEYQSKFLEICNVISLFFRYTGPGTNQSTYVTQMNKLLMMEFLGVQTEEDAWTVMGTFAMSVYFSSGSNNGNPRALSLIDNLIPLMMNAPAFSISLMTDFAGLYCFINSSKSEELLDSVLIAGLNDSSVWMPGVLESDIERLYSMLTASIVAQITDADKYAGQIGEWIDYVCVRLPELKMDLDTKVMMWTRLAEVYRYVGKYDKALEILAGLDVSGGYVNQKYINQELFLNNAMSGRYEEALKYAPEGGYNDVLTTYHVLECALYKEDMKLIKELVPAFLASLSEEMEGLIYYNQEDRETAYTFLMEDMEDDLAELVETAERRPGIKKHVAELLYDYNMISKGSLLKAQTGFHHQISSDDNIDLALAYDLYKAYGREDLIPDNPLLTQLSYSSFISQGLNDIVRFDAAEPSVRRTWENVRDELDEEEYAIEFMKLQGKYYALLLGHKYKSPLLFTLCSDADIMEAVPYGVGPKLYNTPEDSRHLYSLIWKPLLSEIEKGTTIYYSTAGALHQLNADFICDETGTYLSERNVLRKVSTTDCISPGISAKEISNAVIYGDLDYDMSREALTREADGYIRYTPLDDGKRGAVMEYVVPREPLPATLEEVEFACTSLAASDVRTYSYRGEKGTEYSFKSLSGKDFDLLHLATHGFWWESETNHEGRYVLPMKRSGIMLSGSDDVELDSDDAGVLFADEIAGLDLSAVDLLVLSACQTAGGQIKADGVFGLQRGFKQAGVGTIIMTLWPVNSSMTTDLMKEFYSGLAEGRNVSDSFAEARREISRKYPHTRDWAAFIMLD